jgi:putative ABC transport system ATP-binding protein
LNQLNSEGTTIVMVTHDPAHSDHASRIVQMLDGRVLSENVVGLQATKGHRHVQ